MHPHRVLWIAAASTFLLQEHPVAPPSTDHGKVQPFEYPFSFSHKRVEEGMGYTPTALPIAISLLVLLALVFKFHPASWHLVPH